LSEHLDNEPVAPVRQEEMPFAVVQGEPMTVLPNDLYIPPDALEVILEAFAGPLDLLLYLIRRQNLNILDIPIAQITHQYMEYIALMEELRLEIAAEYLVMAAVLAEIKSRMLLPRVVEADDEEDPRAELVRRLQEYERFKHAAEDLDALPRMERDLFPVAPAPPEIQRRLRLPDVALEDLLRSFRDVLTRADMFSHHNIEREALSVRERMSSVLSALQEREFVEFTSLFAAHEGRLGVVVTFIALLELLKSEPFAPIYIKSAERQLQANS